MFFQETNLSVTLAGETLDAPEICDNPGEFSSFSLNADETVSFQNLSSLSATIYAYIESSDDANLTFTWECRGEYCSAVQFCVIVIFFINISIFGSFTFNFPI